MKERTMVFKVVMGALVATLMLPACRTERKEGRISLTEPEQAHEQEMLARSFAESKKAVAARVNGSDITEFLVYREMNALAPRFRKPGQGTTPELEAAIRRDALAILVTQELAVQEARKRGLSMPAEAMDSALREMRERAGSEDAFRAGLKSKGLSLDELRLIVERDYLFEQIAAHEVDGKIRVTEAELRARYTRERAALDDRMHHRMSYEEARPLLELKTRAEAGEKRMRQWEKELRRNARIEIVG